MSVRKRNDFLDDGGSEDDRDGSSGSEEVEHGRGGIGGRASKRRRVDAEQENDSFGELSDEEESRSPKIARTTSIRNVDTAPVSTAEDGTAAEANDDEEDKFHSAVESPSQLRPPPSILPTPKGVARAEKAARKSGVIYISRVPPFMKPHTLKHFLTPHAPKGIGRVFLTPEHHDAYLARKKSGGNKKKSFTDGWIEFLSKTEAKIAAQTLNGNIIGGKKGGYYHDDLWNIKYLKGFKWSHLTEQIAAENAEREARMREEIRKTRQENKAFLEDVEKGKMMATMENRRKTRPNKQDERGKTGPTQDFKQVKVQSKRAETSVDEQSDIHRTLSMIF